MDDNSLGFKAGVAVLIALGGLMFYRMQHPATMFAADGTDPDWDAAVQRSQDANQPTVVLFTAEWCPYCRSLHSEVLSRDDVQAELRSHYSFYTVDLTHPSPEAQAHAQKAGASGIPLLIRYDAKGKETARANGMDAQAMMAWLKAGE